VLKAQLILITNDVINHAYIKEAAIKTQKRVRRGGMKL
jgi:hypothetical protein